MKNSILLILVVLVSTTTVAQKQKTKYIKKTEAISDLDTLISTFEAVHYNPYFIHSKSEIKKSLQASSSTWRNDTVSLKDFMRASMKTTAMMSGGHSYLYWKNEYIIPEIKAFRYLPFTGKLTCDTSTL